MATSRGVCQGDNDSTMPATCSETRGAAGEKPSSEDLLLLRAVFQGEAVRIGRTGLYEIRGGQGLQNILLPAPSGCGAASSSLALPLLPRCL